MMRFRLPKRGSKPDAVKAEHYARLGDNFGSPRRGRYINGDEGQPITGGRFWLQPLTLFILSLLALVLVSLAGVPAVDDLLILFRGWRARLRVRWKGK